MPRDGLKVTEGTHLSALEPSSTYSARVRLAGDSLWFDPFVFVTKSGRYHKSGAAANVKNGYFFSLENWTASWVSYEVAPDQAVEIEVSKLDGTSMRSAVVKPPNRGTVSLVDGKALITVVGQQHLTLDVDGTMDERNTAGWASGNSDYRRVGVAHTFSLFANPLLGDDRPDPNDPDVLTVAPGTEPPINFPQSTLYFLPGVHRPRTIPVCCTIPSWIETIPSEPEGCWCDMYNTSAPGYVEPYLLMSYKNYYVPSDAWIDGYIDTAPESVGGYLRSTRFFGYGVVSGRMFQRRFLSDNKSPKGIHMMNMAASELMGLTLVDTVNHAVILVGKGLGGGTAASDPVNWNSLSHVKVLNWRGNGDGVHCFNYFHDIHDLFLRTQDGSMYFGSGMRSYTTWRRVMTWNDANGIPFMLAANGVDQGHGTGAVEDSDILYHRKQWPEWCGGIFDLRNVNTAMHNLSFRNIHIHDPFPTCPMFDVAGGFSHVTWENVHMFAHSTFRDIGYMFARCDNVAKRRFFAQVSHIPDCVLPPTGIPNRFVAANTFTDAGYVDDPAVRMYSVSFRNVTINGTNLFTLFTDPAYQGAVVTGGTTDITFAEGPYTPGEFLSSPPPPSPM